MCGELLIVGGESAGVVSHGTTIDNTPLTSIHRIGWTRKGSLLLRLCCSLYCSVLFFSPVVDHHSSVQHNEPTQATVLNTGIDERSTDDGRQYRPAVTYQYTVEGEQYTAENVYPGQFTRWHGSRSTAASTTSRYTGGSDRTAGGEVVMAQYNPENPGEAYLYNTGWPGHWYFPVIGATIVFLGGAYIVRVGFKRWQQRTLMQDTPTESAQSLSIGPSELSGTAVPADEPLSAPFSDDDCVLAQYEVEEYDTSGDSSSWDTVDSGVLFRPFYLEDGTGRVLVRPHDEATYDLEPGEESVVFVESDRQGPEAVRQFVRNTDGVRFPSGASPDTAPQESDGWEVSIGGLDLESSSVSDGDRKYRQRLIQTGEDAYVFGTARPRDRENVPQHASNPDRLVVEKITDGSMQEPMFMISDDEERDLVDRRRWALWRLPVGGAFLTVGFGMLLLVFAPALGLEVPRVFDDLVDSVS